MPLCDFQPNADEIVLWKLTRDTFQLCYLTIQRMMIESYEKEYLFFMSMSHEEYSVFFNAKMLDRLPIKELDMYADTFRVLELYCYESDHGIDHIGIVCKISQALSEHNISILYINTYAKNFVLVKQNEYQRTIEVLRHSGIID